MEANQKILYNNFMKVSVEGKTDLLRARCKKAAEDILKSFPQFDPQSKPEVKEPISEEVKEKK